MTVDQLVAEVEKLTPDEKAQFIDKVIPVLDAVIPDELLRYSMTSPIFAPPELIEAMMQLEKNSKEDEEESPTLSDFEIATPRISEEAVSNLQKYIAQQDEIRAKNG